jgi:hypothetical protein
MAGLGWIHNRVREIRDFFFFFYIFISFFCKNIWQNYTSGAVGDSGRDLPPCPTAVGAVGNGGIL